jgi:hypothetical protein
MVTVSREYENGVMSHEQTKEDIRLTRTPAAGKIWHWQLQWPWEGEERQG